MEISALFFDGLFAAVAAVGFGCISNPPLRVLPVCAVVAAMGHSLRFLLMHYGMNIVFAGFLAALVIGILSVRASRKMHSPVESFSFPALLPMIPGMYAYRTVQASLHCLTFDNEAIFRHYFSVMCFNAMMCGLIILMMVIGITLPTLFRQKRDK